MFPATKRRMLAVAVIVAAMLFGAGAAFAQEPPDAETRETRHAAGPSRTRFGNLLLAETMAFLDVTRGDVIATLAGGGTLAELATEHGSSGDALVAALVAVVDTHLQDAVAAGRITPEMAARHLAGAEDRIERIVFGPHHKGRGAGVRPL